MFFYWVKIESYLLSFLNFLTVLFFNRCPCWNQCALALKLAFSLVLLKLLHLLYTLKDIKYSSLLKHEKEIQYCSKTFVCSVYVNKNLTFVILSVILCLERGCVYVLSYLSWLGCHQTCFALSYLVLSSHGSRLTCTCDLFFSHLTLIKCTRYNIINWWMYICNHILCCFLSTAHVSGSLWWWRPQIERTDLIRCQKCKRSRWRNGRHTDYSRL